jgi:hypothetical protein
MNFPYMINLGDTDTPNLPIDNHLAGTTFSNAAFQAAVSSFQAVRMYGKTGLMQGRCNGKSLFTCSGISFI